LTFWGWGFCIFWISVVRNTRWQLYSKSQTPLGKRTYTSLSLSLSLSLCVCLCVCVSPIYSQRRTSGGILGEKEEGCFHWSTKVVSGEKRREKKERRENILVYVLWYAALLYACWFFLASVLLKRELVDFLMTLFLLCACMCWSCRIVTFCLSSFTLKKSQVLFCPLCVSGVAHMGFCIYIVLHKWN
jgi:hypothetical protein